jgi:hypothetical protein
MYDNINPQATSIISWTLEQIAPLNILQWQALFSSALEQITPLHILQSPVLSTLFKAFLDKGSVEDNRRLFSLKEKQLLQPQSRPPPEGLELSPKSSLELLEPLPELSEPLSESSLQYSSLELEPSEPLPSPEQESSPALLPELLKPLSEPSLQEPSPELPEPSPEPSSEQSEQSPNPSLDLSLNPSFEDKARLQFNDSEIEVLRRFLFNRIENLPDLGDLWSSKPGIFEDKTGSTLERLDRGRIKNLKTAKLTAYANRIILLYYYYEVDQKVKDVELRNEHVVQPRGIKNRSIALDIMANELSKPKKYIQSQLRHGRCYKDLLILCGPGDLFALDIKESQR